MIEHHAHEHGASIKIAPVTPVATAHEVARAKTAELMMKFDDVRLHQLVDGAAIEVVTGDADEAFAAYQATGDLPSRFKGAGVRWFLGGGPG